ncbi:MAG: GGDEF domain-containing protein [Deltaproteobacteria bacterium]|nr:GGDEF domain-containing protein [Deltaproteobacteria bacterium]
MNFDDEWETKTVISDKKPVGIKSGNRAYLILLAGNSVGEMFALKQVQVLGRGQQADLRIRGDGISRQHARIITTDSEVLLEDLGSTNGTYVNGRRITRVALKDGDKIQVGNSIILKFTYHDDLEEDFQRQMYDSASRDGLTRVFNKRYFLDHLDTELGYARRHDSPLSLLLFDLDHFKKTNDTFGHPAGDYVLITVTKIVVSAIRREDVFARYGGEEFVILSRNTDLDSAYRVAERIRKSVEEYAFQYDGKPMRITVSIGIAGLPNKEVKVAEHLLVAADQALYEAKNTGRNKTVVNRGE